MTRKNGPKPIKPQTLKGFRDFLPEEALKRKWLENKIRQVFEQWGYEPLETPTLEPLELFEGRIGEDEKLFYKFKDSGGRNVALRYDQTVPTCRVVGQYAQQIPMPFKRYQIQPAFRAEKPQRGRYREFLQCDADIFGVESPLADAEVIGLSLDIYKQLGFKKVIVYVNDRVQLQKYPYEAIASIDKLKKIREEGVIKEMVNKGIKENIARQYLREIKKLMPNETIKFIFDYLKKMSFGDSYKFEFDSTLARSFSYSTGPIWEVVIPGFDAGSVLGGERFDNLVMNISGLNIPGTGFGLGFDRTLEAAEQFGLIPKIKTVTKVLVTIFSKEYLIQSIKVATLIRQSGINCELYPDPEKKLDKQIKYADKKGIPYVVIIGPDEIKNNRVTLKNMKAAKQEVVSKDLLIQKLKTE